MLSPFPVRPHSPPPSLPAHKPMRAAITGYETDVALKWEPSCDSQLRAESSQVCEAPETQIAPICLSWRFAYTRHPIQKRRRVVVMREVREQGGGQPTRSKDDEEEEEV